MRWLVSITDSMDMGLGGLLVAILFLAIIGSLGYFAVSIVIRIIQMIPIL